MARDVIDQYLGVDLTNDGGDVREGFDPRRHALSVPVNGDLGWIQVANFVVCGAMVVAGTIGCRRALRSEPSGTWGPILIGVYGLGMIGAGLFPADPAPGFPPGVEAAAQLSRDGLMHFVMGGIAFYALIAACFVFARRFMKRDEKGMAAYSVVTGVGFFVSFAAIASGSTSAVVMLAFWLAIAWVWGWLTVVLLRERKNEAPAPGLEPSVVSSG